jgi:hypothetical protein
MARTRPIIIGLAGVVAAALVAVAPGATAGARPESPPPNVRFATYNASLNRFNEGDLATELASAGSPQPDVIAEVIQRTRPDVLLINEFDYDAGGVAAAGFQENYLSMPHDDAAPIEYPYVYVADSNTGVPSGFDLNNNGVVGGADDAFGFGFFPGQYAFVVYSMYPIDEDGIRTFATCRVLVCRSIRRRANPGTATRSSTCSACPRRTTSTCRSTSTGGRSTSW